ncbi:MAG: hypothetical protein ACI8XX_000243, partial [Polaribacter sp.]
LSAFCWVLVLFLVENRSDSFAPFFDTPPRKLASYWLFNC